MIRPIISEITVNGEVIAIDLEHLIIDDDITREQSQVASRMAYWAAVWAAAEEEKIRVDASYRNWRAKEGEGIVNSVAKVSEWKIKQLIESNPKFEKYKKAQALALRNTVLTRGIFESFRTKAAAIQSRGAMMRAELDYTGMNTPQKRKTIENIKAIKKINKKKGNE